MSNPIAGKSITLGVTGSIAAYKAADLASKLHQSGAQVDVILTEAALKFITPLTFQSVTARKAYTDADLWGGEGHVTHVAIGHAADLVIVAPASANTLAKLAHGIADNLLTVTVLASTCPLLIAPAMDAGMFSNPATQKNLEILRERGTVVVGPAEGHLASGLVGKGRMVEPIDILGQVRYLLSRTGPLSGKHVVVTAGGTQEPIDPVRFITNRSSGKQGYAIAQAALDLGADVTLITTPTGLNAPCGAAVIHVRTAEEMLQAVLTYSRNADLLIMSAAVADFRPAQTAEQKIKKTGKELTLTLMPTTDILAMVHQKRQQSGFPRHVIGFAAETENLLNNAQKKLVSKGLDMIVANNVSALDAGFEVETNRVSFLFPDGRKVDFPLQSKYEVAERILEEALSWL